MSSNDPYDKALLIEISSRHAWERRSSDFVEMGINSRSDLEKHIDAVMEGQQTHAFHCQPQRERKQTFCREVYKLDNTFQGENGKNYNTTVLLNPNLDENGRPFGGSVWIRGDEKKEFDRLARREKDYSGEMPEIVIGGRSALREQEQHRQVVIAKEESEQDIEKQTIQERPMSRAEEMRERMKQAREQAQGCEETQGDQAQPTSRAQEYRDRLKKEREQSFSRERERD